MTNPKRTEQDVIQALSENERMLLKRVLEIERAKMHLSAASAADLTDDLLTAVKAIIP